MLPSELESELQEYAKVVSEQNRQILTLQTQVNILERRLIEHEKNKQASQNASRLSSARFSEQQADKLLRDVENSIKAREQKISENSLAGSHITSLRSSYSILDGGLYRSQQVRPESTNEDNYYPSNMTKLIKQLDSKIWRIEKITADRDS